MRTSLTENRALHSHIFETVQKQVDTETPIQQKAKNLTESMRTTNRSVARLSTAAEESSKTVNQQGDILQIYCI